MPQIQSDAEATSLANLIQSGKITGADRDSAMAALRAYTPAAPASPPPASSPLAQVPSGPAAVPGASNATSPQAEDVMNAHPELRPPAPSGNIPKTPLTDLAVGMARVPFQAVGGVADIARNAVNTAADNYHSLLHPMEKPNPSAPTHTAEQIMPNALGPRANATEEEGATLGGLIPQVIAGGAGLPLAEGEAAEAVNGIKGISPAVAAARAKGLKVLPSDIANSNEALRGAVPGTGRQALTGNDAVTGVRTNNVPISTDLAAQDIGLPAGITKITPAHRELAEAPLGKAYDEVGASLGANMKGSDGLNSALSDIINETDPKSIAPTKVIKQAQALLDKSKAGTMNGSDLIDNVTFLRKAAASNNTGVAPQIRDLSSALQDEIGSQLTAQGDTAGAAKYQAARTGFAKVQDVFDNLKAGQIDVPALTKLDDDSNGKRLTGNLKLLADFGREAPQSVKFNAGTGDAAAIPHTLLGAASSAAQHIISKVPGVDPLSEAIQSKFGAGPIAPGSASMPSYLDALKGSPQGNLGLQPPLDLAHPPGNAPGVAAQPTVQQPLGLGEALNLQHPPGSPGPAPTNLPPRLGDQLTDQTHLPIGEPLNLQHPPGNAPGVAPREPMNQNQYQFTLPGRAPLDLTPPPGRAGGGLGNLLAGSADDMAALGSTHGKAAAAGGKPEEKGLPTDMADRKREDAGLPAAGAADHGALTSNALKEIVDNIQNAPLTLKDLNTGDGTPPSAMEQFLLALRKSQKA